MKMFGFEETNFQKLELKCSVDFQEKTGFM